jgi:acyl-CoA dehydrogenase
MSTEQTDHRAEVASATRAILTSSQDADDKAWDERGWTALEAAGLTMVAVPEALGGGGGTLIEAAEVVRAAGALAYRGPIAAAALIASGLWEAAGLPVVPGAATAAESGDGITAAALPDGSWRLAGVAHRVPFGHLARTLTVVAHAPEGPVAARVPVQSCTATVGYNLAGEPRDALDVTGVVAGPGDAARLPNGALHELPLRAALGALLLSSGAAAEVQALTVRYIGEREQFGRPIGRQQIVQQLVAELAGEVTALDVGADAALLAVRSHSPQALLTVASAKIEADRAVSRIAALAHQIHGAIGVTHEHPLRRFTLRLWSWRDDGATVVRWNERLAEEVLGADRPTLWEQITGLSGLG